jgi:hypothetical protein
MSAILLAVLAAGMAMDSGPKPMAVETEERLCIGGSWEGTWQIWQEDNQEAQFIGVTMGLGLFFQPERGQTSVGQHCRWVNEGGGKCQLLLSEKTISKGVYKGIYKWNAGRLIICLGEPDSRRRPMRFQVNQTQSLLILRPTRPGK